MFTRPRVLLLVSVVALGAWLWIGAKPFAPEPPPPTPADEFTVSGPFTHGNLTVFLLHGPDTERSRPVLGLDEALARKCAVVHETGSVNELAVENTSEEDDLLLLSGDIVKGGRQDRVLQATMILPPKSGKVPVRSFCVEQSRWTQRGKEDDTRFGGNPGQIAGKELKQAVQLAGSQGEVWSNVQVQQAALSKNVGTVVNSPASPSSLQLALENDKVQAEVAKIREAITKQVGEPAGVVGFVTVVNGQVTGAEAFGSHALFRKAWAKAVNAAAVEAVAEKPTRPFSEMTPAGVKTFLANAGREQQKTEREQVLDEYRRLRESVVTVAGPSQRLMPEGGTADVIAEVNNLVEPNSRNAQAPARVIEIQRPSSNQQVWDNEGLGTLVIRARSREDLEQMRSLAARIGSTSGGFNTNVVRAANINGRYYGNPMWQSVPQNGRMDEQSAIAVSDIPPAPAAPREGKATVVEYREKGNGAVIHKSFLPK